MSDEPFPPLLFPVPWPPPERAVDGFDRIPLLGGVIRSVYECFVSSPCWKGLYDIEEQITAPLKRRSVPFPGWPIDPVQQLVLSAMSEAMCLEKGLDHFFGHPKDPVVLLIWGVYDDLTPLFFHEALRRQLEPLTSVWPGSASRHSAFHQSKHVHRGPWREHLALESPSTPPHLFEIFSERREYTYSEILHSSCTLCELMEWYSKRIAIHDTNANR